MSLTSERQGSGGLRHSLRRRLTLAAMTLGLGIAAVAGSGAAAAVAPVGQAAPAAATAPTAPVASAPGVPSVPTLAVKDILPGMTGYGLTVFQGTKPERFPIRVVGVLRNFMPQTDIILIRSDDPRLLHVGIAAGMSGSPIYIDGKLIGALAYGWSFSKDPIAGVTPIDNMLAELRRPLRGRDALQMAATQPAPLPSPTEPHLVRAAVPLSVSGMTDGASSSRRIT